MDATRRAASDEMLDGYHTHVTNMGLEMSPHSVGFVQLFVRNYENHYARPSFLERVYNYVFNIQESPSIAQMDRLRDFILEFHAAQPQEG